MYLVDGGVHRYAWLQLTSPGDRTRRQERESAAERAWPGGGLHLWLSSGDAAALKPPARDLQADEQDKQPDQPRLLRTPTRAWQSCKT